MSIRVMSKVWDGYPGEGGSELLALLALADWSDDDGRCWPSMTSIARKIRLSEKQTRRVVHALIEAGLVEVTAFHKGGFGEGEGLSRRYRINLDALAPPSPSRGREYPPSRGCPNPPPVDGRQTVSEPPDRTVNKSIGLRPISLPDWFDDELVELWEGFISHRQELGKPLTPAGQETALAKLERLRAKGNDPVEVLARAIMSDRGILLSIRKHGHTGH